MRDTVSNIILKNLYVTVFILLSENHVYATNDILLKRSTIHS